MFKPIPIFIISLLFSALTLLFLFSPVSLNGFKADFYFVVLTTAVNIFSLRISYKKKAKKIFRIINTTAVLLLSVGMIVFASFGGLNIKRVYTPVLNKQNLYAALTLRYKKAYFKKQGNLCGDGIYWETYVPTFFPLIEIETKRNECFVANPQGGFNLYTFTAE